MSIKKTQKKVSMYEANFERVIKLGVFNVKGENVDYKKSSVSGYMDLVVERLPHYDDVIQRSGGLAYALTHWYEINGDLCKDPDMVIMIYPKEKIIEALTFELSIPPLYLTVYKADGSFKEKDKLECNESLSQWLINLLEKGYGKNWQINT